MSQELKHSLAFPPGQREVIDRIEGHQKKTDAKVDKLMEMHRGVSHVRDIDFWRKERVELVEGEK